MCDYRPLPLWQQSQRLADQVFRVTQGVGNSDHYDLARRVRDAAGLIPEQIAAHYSPEGTRFLRGVRHARRSLLRLQQLVDLAARLRYWPPSHSIRLARSMLHLQRHLRAFYHSLA